MVTKVCNYKETVASRSRACCWSSTACGRGITSEKLKKKLTECSVLKLAKIRILGDHFHGTDIGTFSEISDLALSILKVVYPEDNLFQFSRTCLPLPV